MDTQTVALSGSDTAIINGRSIVDVIDGDYAKISFPNEIASVKTGKNGNSVYALNASGKQADFELRLVRGSADDRFLNDLLSQQEYNFAGFVLMTGQFVKNIGDGKGNITKDKYITSGGVFTKRVEAKANSEGDTEQSVAVYTIKFSNAPRILG